MPDWMERPFLGQPLWLWTTAAGIALGAAAVLLAARGFLSGRAKGWSAPERPLLLRGVAALARSTRFLFLLAMALLLGSLVLELGERGLFFRRLIVAVALVQGGVWAGALLGLGLYDGRARRAGNGGATGAWIAVGFLGHVAIWSIVLLLALDNFGVKVTALLAGLGVGGVAVALATQSLLGDLFASLSILLDKPFEPGDFIVVGDLMGTVERIGIKTTRVRSLSGEQIVFSNSDLLASRIRNYKRMTERRVEFTFGVDPSTPPEKLAAIPDLVREILAARPKVRVDRVHFKSIGTGALTFEAVYIVSDPDFTLYMDVQQAANLEILRRFRDEEIALAVPLQKLLHEPAEPRTA